MMNWHWLVPVFEYSWCSGTADQLICVLGGAAAVLAAALCGSLLRK